MALGVVTVDARQSVRVECMRGLHHMTHFPMFDIAALHQPTCEVKAEDQLHIGEFIRKFKYGTYNGFVKGWYGETEDHPISEQCMGDWMHEDFQHVWPVVKKLFRGHWYEIGHKDATNAADAMLNMIYKNIEECGWIQVRDDMMNWCLENSEQCLFGLANAPERVASGEHTMELAAKSFDLFELIMSDDTCQSDIEQVNSAVRLAEDIGTIMRDLIGFEGHLDLTKEHKSMSVFHFIHVISKIFFHDINMAVVEIARALPEPDFSWMVPHWGGRHHHGGHHRGHHGQNPFSWLRCPFTGKQLIPENPFEGMKCPFSGKPIFPQWGLQHEQQPQFSVSIFGQPTQMPNMFANFHLF